MIEFFLSNAILISLFHGFKYWPIPIYIGNILSGLEVPTYNINIIISENIGTDIVDMPNYVNIDGRY